MEEDLKRRVIALEAGGAVALPEGYVLPARLAYSIEQTGCAIVSFGSERVCKTISSEDPDFTLVEVPGKGFNMMRKNKVFLWNVRLEPIVYAGNDGCTFMLDPSEKDPTAYIAVNGADIECLRKALSDYAPIYGFGRCIVSGAVSTALHDVIACIRSHDISYVVYNADSVISEDSMEELRDSGVTRFRLDIIAARRDMFSKLRPGEDQGDYTYCLKTAARVFGKGNVSTIIVCGIGEGKADLDILMESICRAGVVPVLMNASSCEGLRSSLDRIGSKWRRILPEEQTVISDMRMTVMKRHGLDEGCKED